MSRNGSGWRIAGIAGLVSALVVLVAAIPASATLVCPKGTTNPQYCTNVPPVAKTKPATNIGAFQATLNGISGPDVAGGDVTKFHFGWGRTPTPYANRTPSGTVRSCPPGVTNPVYCTRTQPVSARITGLRPCTTYHFRLVSRNPDGTTRGDDKTFTTAKANPISAASVTPQTVAGGRLITITITLRAGANVTIQLIRAGSVVKSQHPGLRQAGTFSRTMKMPTQTGVYTVRIQAVSNCGTQTRNQTVHVT